jgi:trehalose 6-phosphate synthase/phosphatase
MGVSKGETAVSLLADQAFEFIMAAGDDITDETLFQALPRDSYSIKIGKQKTFAAYYLESSDDLLDLLEKMIDYKKGFFRNFIDFFRDLN